MSQSPEGPMSNQVIPLPTPAVTPFERQSDLQKAIRERAQEMIDRENERAVRNRPSTLRRVLVLALATIPVFITFGAAFSFVGALRQFNATVFESLAAQEAAQAEASPATSTEPDVVMLRDYAIPVEPLDEPAAAAPEAR